MTPGFRQLLIFVALALLAVKWTGCDSGEHPRSSPAADQRAPDPAGDTGSIHADSSRIIELLAIAEEALDTGDSNKLVRCLAELVRGPLPDSLWLKVATLAGLGYPIRQVTDNITADYAPRFSPDGRTIVYFSRLEREQLDYQGLRSVRYQSQICTVSVDGGEPTVLSDGKASEFFPDISPDSRYMVTQRAEGDTMKGEWTAATGSYLQLYDLRTGEKRRLGAGDVYGRCPRFMPGGEDVCFMTGSYGSSGWISSINIHTGEVVPRYRSTILTRFNTPYFAFLASFLPERKGMIFQAGYLDSKAIFSADEYGVGIVRLTAEGISERHPAIAPDGKWIAFVSDGRKGDELFVRPVNGGRRRQITFDGFDKTFPSYSPDGRYIVFGAKRKGQSEAEYEIHILDLAVQPGWAEICRRVEALSRFADLPAAGLWQAGREHHQPPARQ